MKIFRKIRKMLVEDRRKCYKTGKSALLYSVLDMKSSLFFLVIIRNYFCFKPSGCNFFKFSLGLGSALSSSSLHYS